MSGLDWLAGIGGGLKGYDSQRQRDEDLQLERQKLEDARALTQLREETKQWIADALERGRNERYDRPSGNVTMQTEGANSRAAAVEDGRNWRWGTTSDNVQAQQAGADSRARSQWQDGHQRPCRAFGEASGSRTG